MDNIGDDPYQSNNGDALNKRPRGNEEDPTEPEAETDTPAEAKRAKHEPPQESHVHDAASTTEPLKTDNEQENDTEQPQPVNQPNLQQQQQQAFQQQQLMQQQQAMQQMAAFAAAAAAFPQQPFHPMMLNPAMLQQMYMQASQQYPGMMLQGPGVVNATTTTGAPLEQTNAQAPSQDDGSSGNADEAKNGAKDDALSNKPPAANQTDTSQASTTSEQQQQQQPPSPPPQQAAGPAGMMVPPMVLQMTPMQQAQNAYSQLLMYSAAGRNPFQQQPVFQPAVQQPGKRGINLSLACDHEQLSEYQMLVRQQLEVFEAGPEDAESNTQGRKKSVVLGQVGLRCKHCAPFPLRARGRGAVYYPAKLNGIYQAAQNMVGSHLIASCQQIPSNIKDEIRELRDRRDNATGGKSYWAEGCQALGLYETEQGLKMRAPPK